MHQQGIEGSAGERTPAVGTWPSAARTVLGWQEGGFLFFFGSQAATDLEDTGSP